MKLSAEQRTMLQSATTDAAAYQRVTAFIDDLCTRCAQLEAANQRHQEMIANVPGLLFRLRISADNRASFDYLGPQCETMLALPQAMLYDNPRLLSDCIVPDDRAAYDAAHADAVRTHQPFTWEGRMQVGDAIRWRRLEARPQRLDDGSLLWDGILLDITARHQADAARHATEERFRALVESTDDVIYTLDRDLRHAGIYGRWLAKAGLTPAHFLGKTARELMGDEAAAVHENANRRALGGESVTYEWSTGAQHYLTTVSPLYDDAGHVSGIVGVGKDITSLIESQTALHEQRAFLEGVSRMLPDAVYVVDLLEARTIYTNNRLPELVGMSQTELDEQGYAIFEHILAPDDFQRLQRLLQNLMQSPDGTMFEAELPFRHSSGDQRWVRVRDVVLTRTPDGRVHQLLGVAQDITDRKQAELALRDSELRYRSLVSALAEGIVMQDAAGRIITCNAAAERILGLTTSQLMGRTSVDPRWRAIHDDGSPFPGEDHPAMVSLRTGEPVSDVVMGVYKPDNTLTWISINAQPMFHTETRHPHAVVTSFVDITAQREMEQALRATNNRLEMIVEGAALGTWDWNIQTGAVEFNARWAAMLGYHLDEIEPDVSAWEQLLHPDDVAHVMDALNAHLAGRAPAYETEHRLRTADGDWLWVLDSGRVLEWDDDGQPLRAAGIHLDIADRKRADQQALQLSLEKERMSVLASFIHSATHEFRTPLSIIQTSSYLASRVHDPETRQRKYTQIEDQVMRMSRLLDLMVLQTRLDSGVAFNFEAIDLNWLIRSTVEQRKRAARDPEAAIALDLDPATPTIEADENWLTDGLLQIIDNALRYSPPDSVITLRTRFNLRHLVIEVKDTGAGIAPDSLPRIFERFFREDASHHSPGLGLGLSIAQAIIARHGGQIEVESEVGVGSLFRVMLPILVRDRLPD